MNFTDKSNSVRVERFKPSGKWYDTWALSLPEKCYHADSCEGATRGAFFCWDMWGLYAKAFEEKSGKVLGDGWKLVIMEPYNRNAHPIMLIGGQKGKS
jgi:hypothetical protein